MFSHLIVLLSGRVGEEVFYKESVTTGASKDFEEAHKLAEKIISKNHDDKSNFYTDSKKLENNQKIDQILKKMRNLVE